MTISHFPVSHRVCRSHTECSSTKIFFNFAVCNNLDMDRYTTKHRIVFFTDEFRIPSIV